jgi:receptor-type tyrosine-protein phosphatase Q
VEEKLILPLFFPVYLVPSEGPPDIQCNFMSSKSLKIEWSVLPVVKAHGIVLTYEIFLERSDGRHIELYNDTQPYNSLNTSFHDLDEYVEYKVEILATTVKGKGPKSDPITCLTDEDGRCCGPIRDDPYWTSFYI